MHPLFLGLAFLGVGTIFDDGLLLGLHSLHLNHHFSLSFLRFAGIILVFHLLIHFVDLLFFRLRKASEKVVQEAALLLGCRLFLLIGELVEAGSEFIRIIFSIRLTRGS